MIKIFKLINIMIKFKTYNKISNNLVRMILIKQIQTTMIMLILMICVNKIIINFNMKIINSRYKGLIQTL